MDKIPRGMLLLDKPVGVTSFQALGACKRLFGTKKIGHAGTLDKFASGLLLVFVGEATRLVPWFVGADKCYQARIRFGSQTATLDPEGEVVLEAPVPPIDSVLACLPRFTGPQNQIPPEYSAIHIDGRRAYERVLAGEKLDLQARPVTIHRLSPGTMKDGDFNLGVACSSGTYVRSLARDLGIACGSAAHLVALRRESVGDFPVARAICLPDRPEPWSIDLPPDAWIAGSRLALAIPGIGVREIKPLHLGDFRNGKAIHNDWFPRVHRDAGPGSDWAVICGDEFAGIATEHPDGWTYRLVFPVVAAATNS